MSILQITEYKEVGNEITGIRLPVAQEPFLAVQQITISGTTAQSAAFNAETRYIRISGDVAFRFRVGANPTALTTDTRMIADSAEYFGVLPGQKIAAITG